MRSRAIIAVRLLPVVDSLICAAIFVSFWDGDFTHARVEFFWALLAVPILSVAYSFFGLYDSHRVEGVSGLMRRVLSAHLAGGLLLGELLTVASHGQRYAALIEFLLVSAAFMLAERWALYSVLQFARSRGYDIRKVCVIGDWERACDMEQRFARHPEWGLRVVCVGEGPPDDRHFRDYPAGTPLEGPLDQVLRTWVIDEVHIHPAPEDLPRESPVLHLCEQYGLLARVVLDTRHHAMKEPSVEDLCGELSLSVGQARRSDWALLLKRGLDVVLAAVAMVVLAPLFLVIAVLLKLSSPGPIIFRQRRIGLHGRKFTMFKFRTMVDGAETLLQSVAHNNITGGPIFKDRNDCRITNFGRILRRFSLDELPQLMNVMLGDMSLVGPRPLPIHESDAIRGEHRRRFSMPPGLTCLWQINGRSNVEYERWMQYDLQYVDGWSLWLDVKVLVRTIPVVFFSKGAF